MNNFATAFSEKHAFTTRKHQIKCPMTMTIYGVPASGKTHFLLDLLDDMKSNFDEIIVYLGAKDAAPQFLNLVDTKIKKPIIKVLYTYNENDLREYYRKLENNQIELIKAGKAPKKVLFVFDDILGLTNLMKTSVSKPSIIQEMFANHRHCNISIIITSQRIKSVIPTIRGLSKYIFVTSLGTNDISILAEENQNMYYSKKDIIDGFEKTRHNGMGHLLLVDNSCKEDERLKHVYESDIKIIPSKKFI
jgi:Poxvirus A32 protein